MNLPDIRIPRSRQYNRNLLKHEEVFQDRCLICGSPMDLTESTSWIQLDDSCGSIEDPAKDNEKSGGGFPVGPDCWKKHPELHPYECVGVGYIFAR